MKKYKISFDWVWKFGKRFEIKNETVKFKCFSFGFFNIIKD